MAKTVRESRATYSVSIDTTKDIAKPVVLKRKGRRIAALVPIAEYDQFVNWRKQQKRSQRKPSATARKRESQNTWMPEQERLLRQEIAAFERLKPALLRTHSNKWVAIHREELVASDDDRVALSKRVREQFGDAPLLIEQVRATPRVYILDSPERVQR